MMESYLYKISLEHSWDLKDRCRFGQTRLFEGITIQDVNEFWEIAKCSKFELAQIKSYHSSYHSGIWDRTGVYRMDLEVN